MDEYAIGDTVAVTGRTITGNVGTVVHLDRERGRSLVRVGATAQDRFAADELQRFGS